MTNFFRPAAAHIWTNFSLRAKALIVVSIPLGAMLAGFVTSYVVNRKQDEASLEVQHRALVRRDIRELLDVYADAEAGVRGYLLTRRGEFLESYRKVGSEAPAAFVQIGTLLKDTPDQIGRLHRVQALANRSFSTLTALVQNAAETSAPNGVDARETELAECRRELEALREAFGVLDAEENRLEIVRTRALRRIERWRDIADVGEVAFGLLGVLAAVQLLIGGVVRQILHLRGNANRLAQEQPLVPLETGTDEIGALARDLETAGGLLLDRKRALQASLTSLEQARDEAERANRAKSEFLSRMSHELRTPLNAILGFGQLLNMQEEDEQKRESLEHITRGGTHLLELINEVLDIARIESGRVELAAAPVDVAELFESSLNLVRPLTGERRIRLRPPEGTGTDNPCVQADPQRVRQVLLNLLANAIKYNREGGEVRLGCEPGLREGHLRLVVQDTGPGLSAEQQDRLFVAFERLGAEHSRVEGTGLGLALSRHLVHAMGGRMGVHSTVGEGSAFWVELPTAAPADGAARAALGNHWFPAAQLPAAREEGAAPCRVLYIEDNLSNLQLVEQVLKYRPRVRLTSARDGSTGLELARAQPPDLILLDLGLPDLPGHEVLRRLRADAVLREVPVVIMSTDAADEQIDRLSAQGAAAYLTKPFQVQEFLRLVDELPLSLVGR